MSIDDEPLDDFYPVCSACGETIDGRGYKVGSVYFCEGCAEEINGTDEAYEARYAAFEGAQETFFGEDA